MGVSEIQQLFEQNLQKIELEVKDGFSKGIPILHRAIEDNDINTIQKLLQRHTNINCKNPQGIPAVNFAMKQKKWEIVKLLAKYGVNLNNPDAEGRTALSEAIYQGNFEHIVYLIDHGANFESIPEIKMKRGVDEFICDAENGDNEYHLAVASNVPVWVFNYFRAGRVNQLNDEGESPLMKGIRSKIQLPIFRQLLTIGADLKMKDKNGNSIFHLAIIHKHMDVIKFFVDNNVQNDCLYPNKQYETPISLSVKHGIPTAVIKSINRVKEGDCSICLNGSENLYYLENCKHSFCRACIEGYLSSFHHYNESFSCPQIGCEHAMSHEDLKDLMTISQFDKYDRALLENHLRRTADFHWCSECEDGGFYNEFQYNDAGAYANAGICSIMQCNSCPAKFCNICSLKIGEGEEESHKETCKGYASLLHIKSLSKICPNCKIFVQHEGGCSHMTCTFCKYQFCYICLGPYKGRQVFDLTSTCSC